MGGGLGHITRFAAFCHSTGIRPVLLTNCEAVKSGRIEVAAERCLFPDAAQQSSPAGMREWFLKVLLDEAPDRLIIDSFPAGILGELVDLPEFSKIRSEYLARILNISRYFQRVKGSLPWFSRVCRLEKLKDDHETLLNSVSSDIYELELTDPPAAETAISTMALPEGYWAVIHSGCQEELRQLWEYASQTAICEEQNPGFVFVCPGPRPPWLPARVLHLDLYPANTIMAGAARVFSAAGFNIMRQMRSRKSIHEVMPFPRALDDQFFRAAGCSKIP